MSKETISMHKLVSDFNYRIESFKKLSQTDIALVQSDIERYSNLSKQRYAIVGKTHGSKKYQAKDAEIVKNMVSVRERVEKIFNQTL